MDDLKWCSKQGKGIRLIEPNLDIAKSYLKDARRDFSLIDKKEPKWNIIKEYYVCYNALYSLLVKCGIKCEIHDCTLKMMDLFGFGKKIQNKLIDLKKERIGVQYYLGDSKEDYSDFAKEFLEICEVKFLELNDLKVKEIKTKLIGLLK
ncbi:MAG: hypothetical protein ABFQ65_03460 [Nanoarchaeota archaeon]